MRTRVVKSTLCQRDLKATVYVITMGEILKKTNNSKTVLQRLWITMPVFNDWESACETILKLSKTNFGFQTTLVVVDDGSTEVAEKESAIQTLLRSSINSNIDLQIVDSPLNSGNQAAIMRGLIHISNMASKSDFIAVMDADGEDKPEDLPMLLSSLITKSAEVVVAKRGSRNQTIGFLFMHSLFRFIFRLLTSKSIDFGNFMDFRQGMLEKILHKSKKASNSLPGLILSVSPQIERLILNRGKRIQGDSRTSLDSLIIWGMELISPFSRQILARILRVSFFICLLVTSVSLILLGVRIFTDFLIPGTASTLLLVLLALLLLLVFLSCISVLIFSRFEAITDRVLDEQSSSIITKQKSTSVIKIKKGGQS